MAQNIEFDIGIDRLISTVKFYHKGKEIYTGQENNVGSQYSLGVAFPVYNFFRLRSEVGYNTARTYVQISYTYVEGGKTKSRYIRPSLLFNEKIYFGLLPEVRYSTSDIEMYINGGALIASESSEEFRDFNVQATKDKWVFGYKFTGGLIFKYKTLGIKFSVGSTMYAKTLLLQRFILIYNIKNTSIGLGLVFNLK
ncbi:MAG: hypothetical protein IPO65_09395 [Saprospiraceae bacterium]|nr:hypothetical protein [Saprospiraceae bacterium]